MSITQEESAYFCFLQLTQTRRRNIKSIFWIPLAPQHCIKLNQDIRILANVFERVTWQFVPPKSSPAHFGSEKSRKLSGAPTRSLVSFQTVIALLASKTLRRGLLALVSTTRSFGIRRPKTYIIPQVLLQHTESEIRQLLASNKMSSGMDNSLLRDLGPPLPLMTLFLLGPESLARFFAGDRACPFFRVPNEYRQNRYQYPAMKIHTLPITPTFFSTGVGRQLPIVLRIDTHRIILVGTWSFLSLGKTAFLDTACRHGHREEGAPMEGKSEN